MGLKQHLAFLAPAIRAARLGAVRAAVALGEAWPARPVPALRAAWAPGVSVLVPERGTPRLLARALGRLRPALARIGEPTEVLVVVNGAPRHTYTALQAEHPGVRWTFHEAPLGFSGALARGLPLLRHGATFLHNSDVALEPDALERLLPWRAPGVFAIAAEILFDDPGRRREETGWGMMHGDGELYDRLPEPDGHPRDALYAGGGASLFDAALLRRFAARARAYAPFYWEDVDWGAQAWRHGLETVFVPGALAWHHHRATIGATHPPAEIAQVVARNGLLFRLRHLPRAAAAAAARESDWTSLKRLAAPSLLVAIAEGRRAARRAPHPLPDPEALGAHVRLRLPDDARPLVLVVSPFRVLPPDHGGARRIHRLCAALAPRWRFLLLSDEAEGHRADAWAHAGPFEGVCLVGGREDGGAGRIARMASHGHAGLQAALDRLAAVHRPDLVQIEHMELAMLRPPAGIPALLSAHDVLLGAGGPADEAEREALARFAAVITCSAEDAALLDPLPATVVPNGADARRPLPPSEGAGLLFAGPFRYAPNREGIAAFLGEVFPALRARLPSVTLTVLAGEDGPATVAGDPRFVQPGVTLVGPVAAVEPYLAAAALTINPLTGTRGSSVKLIESLAAGRCCVSTQDGARGFLGAGLPGLEVARDVPAMLEPLARLLADSAHRHARESGSLASFERFTWESAASRLESVYRAVRERAR